MRQAHKAKRGLVFKGALCQALLCPTQLSFLAAIANTTDKTLKVAARGEANPLINLKGSN
jgi:hypothetical protein